MYLFPDYAADYARYTEMSEACAQATKEDLSRGIFPRSVGCQPTETRLLWAGFMALMGIIPATLYIFFLPSPSKSSRKLWNSDRTWLSILTIIIPLTSFLSPIINFLDAFHIGSEPYLPPYERPIIPSVATYSCLVLVYILGVFSLLRSRVLGEEE